VAAPRKRSKRRRAPQSVRARPQPARGKPKPAPANEPPPGDGLAGAGPEEVVAPALEGAGAEEVVPRTLDGPGPEEVVPPTLDGPGPDEVVPPTLDEIDLVAGAPPENLGVPTAHPPEDLAIVTGELPGGEDEEDGLAEDHPDRPVARSGRLASTADELEAEDELLPAARNVKGRAPAKVGGNRAAAFLRASWAELQRVQWPNRRQVGQATAVVLGFVVIAGGYLGLADLVSQSIVDAIL
jgi:preprotein translocase SecE subunit